MIENRRAHRCIALAAQILGLHQLTSDPAHMPPPDAAWPPHACSMRRETALRLFHTLLFYDCKLPSRLALPEGPRRIRADALRNCVRDPGLSASTRFRSYLLDPRQCVWPRTSRSLGAETGF